MQNVYLVSSRRKTGNSAVTSVASSVTTHNCLEQHGERAQEDRARGEVVRRQRGLRRRRLLLAPVRLAQSPPAGTDNHITQTDQVRVLCPYKYPTMYNTYGVTQQV